MELGAWTLLPPLVIIVMAIKTKSTTSSLVAGALLCCILQYKTGFLTGFIDLMYSVGCNEDTVWYALFVALFGCILGIWSSTGATGAVADKLMKFATTQRRTLVLSWLVGILLFIDDFTSIAVRGTMTKLYDKNKIPRAMLAYIADSTASPMCILIPFGTWAFFYQSVFAGYPEVTALGSPMEVYIRTIPYLFYGWAALLIPLLLSLGVLPQVGAMKKAYQRAQATGELYGPESRALNSGSEDAPAAESGTGSFKQVACFLVPLGCFIAAVLATGDVIIACMLTLAVLVAMCLVMRVAGWGQMMGACMNGIKDMTSMIVIVFAAYMVRDSLIAIGLPEYVVAVARPFMSPELLPLITFIACTILTFASGSNWGATLAVAAIVIPLCAALQGNMILVLAAIVSGAAFGAHVCFYCDVTVFTSGMTKIDNIEHAVTQLPYGLLGMAVSCVGYLLAGFLLH